MLGDSSVLGGSSEDAATVAATTTSAAGGGAAAAYEGGGESSSVAGVGSNSGEEDRGGRGELEGERSFGGNRWPRQETLALLKIRSDMDVAFRDASIKGPLWEEVSRKLAEIGYNRSAKKCKEKFENVYKYHKRTKEGRTGKPDGKTYRFFDQLEALENHPLSPSPNPKPNLIQSNPQTNNSMNPSSMAVATTTAQMPPPPVSSNAPLVSSNSCTVPSMTLPPMTMTMAMMTSTISEQQQQQQQPIHVTNLTSLPSSSYPSTTTNQLPTLTPNPTSTDATTTNIIPPSHDHHNTTLPSSFPTDFLSNSTSSSTSSDEVFEGKRKRKRKWKDFFERLMKEVIDKQEQLQKRFLEAIEKRERERMAREECWRAQEMARINREREILAQERSMAAAKDSAVMAFLQKIAEQKNLGPVLNTISQAQVQVPPQPAAQAPPTPIPVSVTSQQTPHALPPSARPPPPHLQQPAVAVAPAQQQHAVTSMEITKTDNGDNLMPASSSRWPKVEVQALIKLRTNLDAKYQESGPKGPLWEEISAAMRKLGYNRNAKRCKEKWENINKYFKKVKESNKKRPEDSKTCPYFHQLDALYREKNKFDPSGSGNNNDNNQVKPENLMAPLMVQPEQQWPPQQETRAGPEVTMEDVARHNPEADEGEGEDDDEEKDGEDEEEEDDDDEGGGNYEIVASKPASVE